MTTTLTIFQASLILVLGRGEPRFKEVDGSRFLSTAEGFDGVEPSGLSGRIDAEYDANC